ncbi:hypothetical protein [Flavobacterium rhizosphaerae]|uniref:Uncharacterized protein n=1 Tax=Flavobacterium rhizosphaerae TaxID=3163298 RepID=A0ABW8YS63_9FLAO
MPKQVKQDIRLVFAGFFIAAIIAILVFSNLFYDLTVVYPETKKLESLVVSKVNYGDALQYVKIDGRVALLYETRYGIYFGIKPKVFDYVEDSIANKRVFYIKKYDSIVWFCQLGSDYNLRGLKQGNRLKTDFGEMGFTIEKSD